MKFVCEFVTKKGTTRLPLENVERFATGRTPDYTDDRSWGYIVPREELDNKPKFDGFVGPMWGGYTNPDEVILRYETPEVYEMLSS